MKIAIIGAGGVGGFFGGLLARAGHTVIFVARGSHLRAIQEHGLRVECLDDPFTIVPAHATDDLTTIGPVDLVMLCVKQYGLAAVMAGLPALIGPQTVILTLQNGVEAPDLVAAALGRQVVLPGLAYCEVAVREPGVIFQGSPPRRIVFGEFDGLPTQRATTIAEVLSGAGIDVLLSENVPGALWAKCCFICAMSGVTALTRRPLGPLLADPETRLLLQTVMTEVCAVAMARGVHFDTDPIAAGMAMAERFPPGAKSSMLRDLERGGQLEIEALNGAVVRIGRMLNLPTPANQAIYATLRLYNAGITPV